MKSVSRFYSFFDVGMKCTFPQAIVESWELLYSRFRQKKLSLPCDVDVTVREHDDDHYSISINDQPQSVKRHDAMLYLQDLVQNHVLTAVRSHLLWHAALWDVGGRGIMILGASGMGKTTLSLAHNVSGGRVLSDEIAAWRPDESLMHGFPRALAVRPDTLLKLGDRRLHTRVRLDEEKALIALPHEGPDTAIPLASLCVLQRPLDRTVDQTSTVFEIQVLAADHAWRDCLRASWPALKIKRHPESKDWWRCTYRGAFSMNTLEAAIKEGGAVLAGFHRGARRKPTFARAPVLEEMETSEAAEIALAELINARTWTDQVGPLRLMAMVRTALRPARCVRCSPGSIAQTRAAIERLAA